MFDHLLLFNSFFLFFVQLGPFFIIVLNSNFLSFLFFLFLNSNLLFHVLLLLLFLFFMFLFFFINMLLLVFFLLLYYFLVDWLLIEIHPDKILPLKTQSFSDLVDLVIEVVDQTYPYDFVF
jgi:hypothetical protein